MKPYRYRTAEESRKPGYLARRFKAYKRLQRIKDEQAAKAEAEATAKETARIAAEAEKVTPLKRAAK